MPTSITTSFGQNTPRQESGVVPTPRTHVLRPNQARAFDALGDQRLAILNAPTGWGKSLLLVGLAGQDLLDDSYLDFSEVGFAELGKNCRDSHILVSLDKQIGIDEGIPEVLRQQRTNTGFTDAHEAGEDNVLKHSYSPAQPMQKKISHVRHE